MTTLTVSAMQWKAGGKRGQQMQTFPDHLEGSSLKLVQTAKPQIHQLIH